jgi:hypothetical protein
VSDRPDVDPETERRVRMKVAAEIEAAKARWAADVPDYQRTEQGAFRRGINLALLVVRQELDKPLHRPVRARPRPGPPGE